MYKNIGKKIKTLAKVLAWIGIMLSVLFGLALILLDEGETQTTVAGVFYILLGPVISWLGSLMMYGFGQLVDNSDRIANQIAPKAPARKTAKRQAETVEADPEMELHERYCSYCGSILKEDDCPFCGHINPPERQSDSISF